MHVHNKYLLPSLFAVTIAVAACSHPQPPPPAAQKGSVASSFGTQDTASPANATPPPPVVNPIQPGQATFGPGPKPGFQRAARGPMLRPEVAAKLAQLEAKAQARSDEAAKREVIGGQVAPPPPPPPPPPPDQGH